MKVLIMAGGTGGHIFPAAAVAEQLQQQGATVRWLGSERGMEGTLVPKMGYEFCALPVSAWHGGRLRKLLAPINLLRAVLACLAIFRREQPDVVVGFGGYSSAPGGLVAVLLRTPLILHEQNGVPGLTNKKLARFADAVLQAFPQTFKADYAVVGNPVRDVLCRFERPIKRGVGQSRRLKVLILGGSQGAQAINELVPEAVAIITHDKRPEVWHQTGQNKSEIVQRLYAAHSIEATVVEFITDMARAYQWADVVISRSGASTVSELASVGLFSLLVPYPWHRDRQQYRNAQWLVDNQAATLLEQSTISAESLAGQLQHLDRDRQQLAERAEKAWQIGIRDSAQQIARVITETVKSRAA